MSLLAEYQTARHQQDLARLRRVLALRAMGFTGMTQRQIAGLLGVTQAAISQQLSASPDLGAVHGEALVEAARPILKVLAAEHGYSGLSIFGSVARHQARPDSDIDLLVDAPEGTSSFDFLRF